MASQSPIQRFAIIGLGRFGSRLAANLTAAGQEVIAVDQDIQRVDQIRDRVTLAVAMDATDEQAMRGQGVDQVDVAVVGIGDDFQARVLSTVTLKQMGVAKVISRAVARTDADIMRRVGADDVVNPEDESADRWAVRLANPWFLSCVELDADHSIIEINTPKKWVDKTLIQLAVRKNFGVHVVAIKHRFENAQGAVEINPFLQIPIPDQPLGAHDVLVVMGGDAQLSQVGQG